MCNAWNHPANCRCGWGGDGHAGRPVEWARRITPAARWQGASTRQKVARNPLGALERPNAHCPVCGALVYFALIGNGGRVFFDDLGHPWPKHPCTDNPSARVRMTPVRTNGTARARPAALSDRSEWVPIEIGNATLGPTGRTIPCVDLATGARFQLATDVGFQVEDHALASLSPWYDPGWALLSILRLGPTQRRSLVPVRRDSTVRPIGPAHEFWSVMRREESRLGIKASRAPKPLLVTSGSITMVSGGPGKGTTAVSKREERMMRERAKAEAKLALRADKEVVLAEMLALSRDPDDAAVSRLGEIRERWRRMQKLPRAEEQEFVTRFQRLEREITRTTSPPAPPPGDPIAARAAGLLIRAEELVRGGPWSEIEPAFRAVAAELTHLQSAPRAVESAAIAYERFQEVFVLARNDDRESVQQVLADLTALRASSAAASSSLTTAEALRDRYLAARRRAAAVTIGAELLTSRIDEAVLAALQPLTSEALDTVISTAAEAGHDDPAVVAWRALAERARARVRPED